MRLLAIDPATKCGFAHSCGASGVWDISVRRDESSGMKLIRLRGKLREMGVSVGVDVLAFEAARHAAPKMQGALVAQAELQAVIKEYCHDEGIEYRGYSPSEVKKFATGKGNAKKTDMLAAARARWPNVTDDNEADALFILELLRRDVVAPRPAAGDADGKGGGGR